MNSSPWWRIRCDELLATFGERDCAYVYDPGIAAGQARSLLAMRSVSRVFYALKANPHPAILKTLAAAGLGFECVSRAEVEHVRQVVPGVATAQILFTPNFAPAWQTVAAAGFEVGSRGSPPFTAASFA